MMVQTETAESGSPSNIDSLLGQFEGMKYILGNGRLSLDNNNEQPEIEWKSNWANENKQSVNIEKKRECEQKEIDQPIQRPDEYMKLGHEGETSGKNEKHMLYLERIKQLQAAAEEDGYVLNSASKINFEQFILSEPNIRKGNLILMDNGNLRATWTDNKRNRIGLQFIGMQMIQYLFFKHRPHEKLVSRSIGRDSFNGIKQLIDAFDLKSLFYE